MSPLITLEPVLVIPEPARTAKLSAVLRFTAVAALIIPANPSERATVKTTNAFFLFTIFIHLIYLFIIFLLFPYCFYFNELRDDYSHDSVHDHGNDRGWLQDSLCFNAHC